MNFKNGFLWFWHKLLEHLATAPVISAIGFLVTLVWGLIDFDSLKSYIDTHPWRIIAAVALASLLVVGTKGLIKVRERLIVATQYQDLIAAIGLHYFDHHGNQDSRSTNWKRCVSHVANEAPHTICILGATGWETFGSPQSPIHNTLREFAGELRIMLIKPGSLGFGKRCFTLKRREDEYAKQINDSIEYCKLLTSPQHNADIQVRLYESDAIWKMIFTNSFLWLQHYDPNRDVDLTPVYNFQTQAGPLKTSLYYPFVREFKRLWNEPLNEKVDLLNWNRPQRFTRQGK